MKINMEPIYQQEFHINDAAVDCFGRLRPSMLLFYVQEVAGLTPPRWARALTL